MSESLSTIYSHWSKKPLVLDRNFAYRDRGNFKPAGLWFDVDGDWRRWCEGESFHLGEFAYRNILTFDAERILRLKTAQDIDKFTKDFGRRGRTYESEIQWQDVRERFSGIVIAPYCWARRLEPHTFWYYGWDCASGCIWDIDAITSVETVKVPEYAEMATND